MTALPPYAGLLGLVPFEGEADERQWRMAFGDRVLGRPGFLHGGAIAGLLEFAALGAVKAEVGEEVVIKPINVTVDYLRGGIDHDTFASAEIIRIGKRTANVEARAWQQDRAKPIAAARMNLLLKR